jgi:hypothetical protein
MLGLDGIFFGGSRLEDKKEAAIFVNQHPDDPAGPLLHCALTSGNDRIAVDSSFVLYPR